MGVIPISAALVLMLAPHAAPPADRAQTAYRIADFLLSMQDGNGALRDGASAEIVNEDSNMEYALIGLAAAHDRSHDARYLAGLESGIRWLAAREEMTDPEWRGSWHYAYAAAPPYAPRPVSPGPGISDVRGVDATSALFAYLVYLHATGSGVGTGVASDMEPNVRAGLDFLLARSRGRDRLFNSSWQQDARTGAWRLWRYQYCADQADVYLGMRAGWLLYGDERYRDAADAIRRVVGRVFYLKEQCRYAVGRDESAPVDRDLDSFDGVFPQGYVPWALGRSRHARKAFAWLGEREQSDGSLVCFAGDPRYSLSAALDAMAAHSLGKPREESALDWIVSTTFDPGSGAVRDTAQPRSPAYSNVAGFAIMAMLDFKAFDDRAGRPAGPATGGRRMKRE